MTLTLGQVEAFDGVILGCYVYQAPWALQRPLYQLRNCEGVYYYMPSIERFVLDSRVTEKQLQTKLDYSGNRFYTYVSVPGKIGEPWFNYETKEWQLRKGYEPIDLFDERANLTALRMAGTKDPKLGEKLYAEWIEKRARVNVASIVASINPEPPEVTDHYESEPPELIPTPGAKVSHYNDTGLECIEYIKQRLGREGFVAWLRGEIMKYNHRLMLKDTPLSNATKLAYYANRLQAELQEQCPKR